MISFTVYDVYTTVRKHVKIGASLYDEASVPRPTHTEWFSAVISSMSITGIAIRVFIVISLPPFMTATFGTCWNCYDFEAGAAHEIGHLLGLGHPELVPNEVLGGYEARGQNCYHESLSGDNGPYKSIRRFNEQTCLNPWEGVRNG